ncbi:hypothetical protein UlMin_015179, partial [Ulmus minor]
SVVYVYTKFLHPSLSLFLCISVWKKRVDASIVSGLEAEFESNLGTWVDFYSSIWSRIRKLMAGKKIIAICQSGGEFVKEKDGTLLYRGGDAHAIDIDEDVKFDDFKTEVAEMFNCSIDTMSVKYFLPRNRKTLISVTNDKDLKRLIKFHGESATTDIFVIMEEIVAPDVSAMPA